MYLFISKGAAAADDDDEAAEEVQHQYQQPVQHYPTQQYNQPPPNQHYNQQPQGQFNRNQSYSYQQQQSYPQHPSINDYQGHNQFGVQTLPPQEAMQYHYTNAGPQMSPTARGQPIKANDNHLLAFTPAAVMKEPEKPVRPPTPPKIGWTCPTCTVVNEPYRPGCELCSTARPNDYKPPADYMPTKEEERFLQEDKGLEEVRNSIKSTTE